MILIEVFFLDVGGILLAIVLSVAVRKIPIQYVSRTEARGGVKQKFNARSKTMDSSKSKCIWK